MARSASRRPADVVTHGEVEGLRLGRFRFGINSSCLVWRLGSTLIDAGPPNQWPRLRGFAAERGIERVLLTHHHEDHSGNAGPMAEELDAEVLAPAASLALLRDGFRLRPYQRLIWGTPRRLRARPVPERVELAGGFTLRSIPTPGHAPDMTCYLEPDRGWLFAGDLYITSRPRFSRAGEELPVQIASLGRVLELEFDTVFCGHRGVVADGRRAIQEKHDYLVELRQAVLRLHAEGRSPRTITRTLLGRETALSLLTLYDFSKRNLTRACLGRS